MTHDEFVGEYLDIVEDDAVAVETPPSWTRLAKQAANNSVTSDNSGEEQETSSVLPSDEQETYPCKGCNVDTFAIDEYYMVQFHIWRTAVPAEHQRDALCIGCLEGYLGRELVSEDFIEAPVNYTRDKSERLLNRMGDWFRAFDGPFETQEEFEAAMNEIGRRMDGLVSRDGAEKPVVRINVDTNNIVRGGLTLAYIGRQNVEIKVGDVAIAHDVAEQADFDAVVVAVEGNKAYLKLNWDSAIPW